MFAVLQFSPNNEKIDEFYTEGIYEYFLNE